MTRLSRKDGELQYWFHDDSGSYFSLVFLCSNGGDAHRLAFSFVHENHFRSLLRLKKGIVGASQPEVASFAMLFPRSEIVCPTNRISSRTKTLTLKIPSRYCGSRSLIGQSRLIGDWTKNLLEFTFSFQFFVWQPKP
jgi:hypothetical protein